MLLTDKLALVTGGGRGLGAAISKGLAAEGARVVVVDLNADNARGIAEGIEADGDKAFFEKVDVANAADVDALAARVLCTTSRQRCNRGEKSQ